METIIGLLFILLPVIFKLIGKKLEQSGHTGQAETIRKIAEALGDDAEAECDEDGQIVHLPEQPSAKPSVQPQPVVPVRVVQEEGKQGIIRKRILQYSRSRYRIRRHISFSSIIWNSLLTVPGDMAATQLWVYSTKTKKKDM